MGSVEKVWKRIFGEKCGKYVENNNMGKKNLNIVDKNSMGKCGKQ